MTWPTNEAYQSDLYFKLDKLSKRTFKTQLHTFFSGRPTHLFQVYKNGPKIRIFTYFHLFLTKFKFVTILPTPKHTLYQIWPFLNPNDVRPHSLVLKNNPKFREFSTSEKLRVRTVLINDAGLQRNFNSVIFFTQSSRSHRAESKNWNVKYDL